MYLHLYQGSPTVGLTDGVAVSEGTHLSPVTTAYLNASNPDTGVAQKLALRCDAGYLTNGSTLVTLPGANATDWQLAPDNAGAPGVWQGWGASLTIAASIGATNTILWAQARSQLADVPQSDITVAINFAANVQST